MIYLLPLHRCKRIKRTFKPTEWWTKLRSWKSNTISTKVRTHLTSLISEMGWLKTSKTTRDTSSTPLWKRRGWEETSNLIFVSRNIIASIFYALLASTKIRWNHISKSLKSQWSPLTYLRQGQKVSLRRIWTLRRSSSSPWRTHPLTIFRISSINKKPLVGNKSSKASGRLQNSSKSQLPEISWTPSHLWASLSNGTGRSRINERGWDRKRTATQTRHRARWWSTRFITIVTRPTRWIKV